MRIDDTRLFGKGAWAGNSYILEHCPLCGDRWTFRFLGGGGEWGCPSCYVRSTSFEDLRTELLQKPEWAQRLGKVGVLEAPEGLKLVSTHRRGDAGPVIGTGFSRLDHVLGGLEEGSLTILSGKRGEGKSTFASQLALNAVHLGAPVCFYSGELTADIFQSWVFQQAAGPSGVEAYRDAFGAERFRASALVEIRTRRWLGKKLVLYDNTVVKHSERNTILERFQTARQHFDCRLFVIDNLMTARFGERESDYYRQQSAFVGQLVEFCLRENVHLILVAHPKKVGDHSQMDENDQVSGIADITNRATSVLKVQRLTDAEREKLRLKGQPDCSSVIKITKNRRYGITCDIPFDYEITSRRFRQQGGTQIVRYGWEDEP
jgi:twinkle protein